MRSERLRGGIQWDADLNMINGGPGLQIPSSSCSQPLPDRLPLKVASAITAQTRRLFVPRAQEGEMSGCRLSLDHNRKGYRRSAWPTGLEFSITTSQPTRDHFDLKHSAVFGRL